MGGCCQRNENLNLEKFNSYKYAPEETKGILNTTTKPELKLTQNKLELDKEETQLLKIIQKLQYLYKDKVQIFTEIELFNLAIYFKENYINSDYLIYDMRISSEQKEYYLKKIKHINYTFDQIRNIKKINKFEMLESFIDSKKIIVIIPEYYLQEKNNSEGFKKVEEYPIELCNLLFNINNNITFKILNSCLIRHNDKSDKLEEYLSVFHTYDFIPYILFTYRHLTTFYKEGFFFISFLGKPIFSFEEYINEMQNPLKNEDNNNHGNMNEIGLKNKFMNEMNVTAIINIDNNLTKYLEIKSYQYKIKVFKEIIINKNHLKNDVKKVKRFCSWLKEEIKKGRSCYFNIEKYSLNDLDNGYQKNNWILIIVFIITYVTEVEYTSVIDYLKVKMIYIDKLDKIFENNINYNEIKELLSIY